MKRDPNPSRTCRTCSQDLARPFRVYDERGKVVLGCIDPDHDEHLIPMSESLTWALRPQARKARRAILTCDYSAGVA
jgi:hypothetical protein